MPLLSGTPFNKYLSRFESDCVGILKGRHDPSGSVLWKRVVCVEIRLNNIPNAWSQFPRQDGADPRLSRNHFQELRHHMGLMAWAGSFI